jgi:SAM-dependent methyltransferase
VPLAYHSRAATQEFWTEHWGGQDVAGLYAGAERSPLTALIERGLGAGGPVVEAGCGLGQYVLLLRARGHRVFGADWSLEALRRCKAHAADAPVAVMDLAVMPLRDGAAGTYLSLGVVEHDPAGPDRLLAEARRVLAPGGRLILSVPYLNGVRRLGRPWLARRQAALRAAGGEFYQYAFTRREVSRFLTVHGFEVLSLTPYDPARLLRKALGRVRARRGRAHVAPGAAIEGDAEAGDGPRGAAARNGGGGLGGAGATLARRLLYTAPALRLLGHMILAVAVKR